MLEAAEHLQYEKAMALRDRLQAIEWLDNRLQLLRQARQGPAWIYPLVGWDGRQRWYLLQHGQVCSVCFAPTTPNECRQLLARFPAGGRNNSQHRSRPEKIDSVLLVAAWFRRYPQEQQRLLTPQQALRAMSTTCSDETILTSSSA